MNAVKGGINRYSRNGKVRENQRRYFLSWKIFKHNYVAKGNKST